MTIEELNKHCDEMHKLIVNFKRENTLTIIVRLQELKLSFENCIYDNERLKWENEQLCRQAVKVKPKKKIGDTLCEYYSCNHDKCPLCGLSCTPDNSKSLYEIFDKILLDYPSIDKDVIEIYKCKLDKEGENDGQL